MTLAELDRLRDHRDKMVRLLIEAKKLDWPRREPGLWELAVDLKDFSAKLLREAEAEEARLDQDLQAMAREHEARK